jgi:hypothetical protein
LATNITFTLKDFNQKGWYAMEKDKFTPIQRKAIEALSWNANIRETANAVDVPPEIIIEWKKDPKFQSAVSDKKRENENLGS